ncbi:zinc ribbon domain-containing protein [Okeania hirsuta]|uniref:zinc ribbon domain-containing protein n=1 Tax=Okeania TaxID=1458928 RepID=UPI0013751F37|nr:transposase [Okeania sp. SIO4D6]NEP75273.1 transposase [Okeania sp. SIO2G5]NEP96373.1 transposase [Okeania sp. SIO2F5]NEQ94137.1 transposase [Okeania sp. SIO2G4]NES79060.1 transposase [Okeania sp. SIO1H4]NES89156.1 transposase [Okeania sp. SIO2B9]NET22723.1 transposase [Okeania sp. SIO1H5]NET79100.1 transposase [Okeania sp. SIO1F9]NET96310.1 transposase [Okeania sp. SIO1H2]
MNVSGILANHNPPPSPPGSGARGVGADQGFYEFRRQLEYKCQWYDCELVIVDRFFPSSKTCSRCSHIQDMPLNLRTFDCSECGISIDRDLNPSIKSERCGRLDR